MKNLVWSLILFLVGTGCAVDTQSSNDFKNLKPIARMVKEKQLEIKSSSIVNLFIPMTNRLNVSVINSTTKDTLIRNASHFTVNAENVKTLLIKKSDCIFTSVKLNDTLNFKLDLVKVNPFTEDYKVFVSSNPSKNLKNTSSLYYYGIANGDVNSLVALTIEANNEISGVIAINNENYVIGKLTDPISKKTNVHTIYPESVNQLDLGACGTQVINVNKIKNKSSDNSIITLDQNNCVEIYAEAQYTLYTKLGSNATTVQSHVEKVFVVVNAIFTNEQIKTKLKTLKIWNTPDPYPATNCGGPICYLPPFETAMKAVNHNGGDISCLLGPLNGPGLGGIASGFGTLCPSQPWPYREIATAGENSCETRMTGQTFDYPRYSADAGIWAHELGHNFGSPHTHSCSWNLPGGYQGYGTGTVIDLCTTGEGGSGCIDRPEDRNYIMSYCSYASFVKGFGTQSGNVIRGFIHTRTCLDPCDSPPANVVDAGISEITTPSAAPCVTPIASVVKIKNYGTVTLTSATIEYFTDTNTPASYSWTGNLAANAEASVTLPNITLLPGTHTFTARTKNPNGQTDSNPSNDSKSKTYTYDVDACECENIDTPFPNSPLVRASGTGSASTSLTFTQPSKNITFTVSGMGSYFEGPNSKRYVERVTVTYTDTLNNLRSYGIFNGSIQSTAKIRIPSVVKTVTVKLDNGYSSTYNGNLTVNLTTVNICEIQ